MRKWLLFWTWFIGIGAFFGASAMFLKPDGSLLGMQGLLPYFQVLPLARYLYQDYLFPGIALLCVNGIPNVVAALLIGKRKRSGEILGGVLGLTLMAWITIQFVIFPLNFMDIWFFINGILQAVTGFVCFVSRRQMESIQSQEPYGNPAGSDTLVVFFSRNGYARSQAVEMAKGRSARLLELKTKERTEGDLGFWWCGRFGMHQWPMAIEPYEEDVSSFRHVIVVTPVWVFSVSAPVRQFLMQEKGRFQSLSYVLVHFTKMLSFGFVGKEMDGLCGGKAGSVTSVCVKWGKVRSRKMI